MLHELLIVPAAITPVRGHVAGERDGRQDRERRADALDEPAGLNFREMRGGPVCGRDEDERQRGIRESDQATCRFRLRDSGGIDYLGELPDAPLVSFPRRRIPGHCDLGVSRPNQSGPPVERRLDNYNHSAIRAGPTRGSRDNSLGNRSPVTFGLLTPGERTYASVTVPHMQGVFKNRRGEAANRRAATRAAARATIPDWRTLPRSILAREFRSEVRAAASSSVFKQSTRAPNIFVIKLQVEK